MSEKISWYKRKPKLYESEQLTLNKHFPTLMFVEEGNRVYVSGKLPLKDNIEGEDIEDVWDIEIDFPFDYPFSLPEVREVGGRIKKSTLGDRHFFSNDGTACLCYKSEWRYFFTPGKSDVKVLLNDLVIPFFYGQSYFDKTGDWPFGEYSHDAPGMIQFYSRRLKEDDPITILGCIRILENKGTVKGHWMCPCGSSKKIRDCHPKLQQELSDMKGYVFPENAKEDILRLQTYIEKTETEKERRQQNMNIPPTRG
ncbi:MAG: hypothetical protein ACYC5A_04240 [Thermoleophilia bacterium]